MKYILFLLLLNISFLYAGNNHFRDPLSADTLDTDIEAGDGWFSRDKGLHLAGNFITTGLFTLSSHRFMDIQKSKSRVVGLSVSISLSLGKEFYDSRQQNNHFCFKDLTADMLGIALALLVFK